MPTFYTFVVNSAGVCQDGIMLVTFEAGNQFETDGNEYNAEYDGHQYTDQ